MCAIIQKRYVDFFQLNLTFERVSIYETNNSRVTKGVFVFIKIQMSESENISEF